VARASHVIIGAYGFWLPNDQRGSWSRYVGSRALLPFGDATGVHDRTTRSAAHDPFDVQRRDAAKAALKRPAVVFNGHQARAIARGFAAYAERSEVAVHACAIMPDHIHIVIDGYAASVDPIVVQLKGAATRQLIAEDLHPFMGALDRRGRRPSAFARGCWKVYLDDDADVERSIRYVEQNPIRAGFSPQRWRFVTPWGTG
jgi:REP element-mobilizing transposase RayT